MKLTEEIRKLALANNMDYVGFAPISRLQNEPQDFGPFDFLPGARSVVVMGMRLSLGVQLSNKLAHRGHRNSLFTYLWHGFGLMNMHFLDRTALVVTRFLENEGHIATPIHSSSPIDVRASLAGFSNMHAAVAAGLGEMGWNGFALTSDVGPRARFVSVLTTAELDASPMYDGAKLCDRDKCRQLGHGRLVCESVCPVTAMSTEGSEIRIGDKRFAVAKLDSVKCMWGSMGLSKGSLALCPVPMPDKPEVIDVAGALGKRDPAQIVEVLSFKRGDYCGRCIMECPAGSPKIVEDICNARKS